MVNQSLIEFIFQKSAVEHRGGVELSPSLAGEAGGRSGGHRPAR